MKRNEPPTASEFAKQTKGKYDHAELRDREGHWYREEPLPEKFDEFAEVVLLPKINFTGYKVPEKKYIATHCLLQLIGTGLTMMMILCEAKSGQCSATHKKELRAQR